MNYDFSGWHPTCTKKGLLVAGDGLHVYCMDCGISANVEAISGKISPADACRVGVNNRTVLGKQSPGIDRGAEIK